MALRCYSSLIGGTLELYMRAMRMWRGGLLGILGVAAVALGQTSAPSDLAYDTKAPASVTSLSPAPIVPTSINDLQAIQTRVEAVVKATLPATVGILLDDAQGSGVIVSPDGYVLTAGHVSGTPGQRMWIVLSTGKRVHAKALGANNGIDSGMVKITDTPPAGGFPHVSLGTAKGLKAGQWVVAMGHPLGYREDRPPVVRLGRVLLANYQLIGTDCPLISGDSGGPVFDLDGRLIGINSRIGATTTANIHVPIDTFTQTWTQLAKGEEWGGGKGFLTGRGELPVGASLGVNAKPDERGARVDHVKSGTPAEKGGLKAGDVVMVFGGLPIKGPDDLADDVDQHSPGDWVKMQVLRDGKKVWVTVKLAAKH